MLDILQRKWEFTENKGFPVLENGKFPFGKRGAKATQNSNHYLVRV